MGLLEVPGLDRGCVPEGLSVMGRIPWVERLTSSGAARPMGKRVRSKADKIRILTRVDERGLGLECRFSSVLKEGNVEEG